MMNKNVRLMTQENTSEKMEFHSSSPCIGCISIFRFSQPVEIWPCTPKYPQLLFHRFSLLVSIPDLSFVAISRSTFFFIAPTGSRMIKLHEGLQCKLGIRLRYKLGIWLFHKLGLALMVERFSLARSPQWWFLWKLVIALTQCSCIIAIILRVLISPVYPRS